MPFNEPVRDPPTRAEAQRPLLIIQQSLRRVGVGVDVDPTFDTPRGANPTQLDPTTQAVACFR